MRCAASVLRDITTARLVAPGPLAGAVTEWQYRRHVRVARAKLQYFRSVLVTRPVATKICSSLDGQPACNSTDTVIN